MKMLIASDLHGTMDALDFIRARANELSPDMLVFLGDLVYHGPRNPLPRNYDTGAMLMQMPHILDLPCPVIAVRGNCDAEVDVVQMPFKMPDEAWLDVDGHKIFACHGHHLPDRPPIPQLPAGTIVLRGHTHIPRGETIDGISFWNRGSLSLPKGGFPKSYGIYQNGIFQVLDKKGNVILSHKTEN